jgi:hypothetical protein
MICFFLKRGRKGIISVSQTRFNRKLKTNFFGPCFPVATS